MLLLINYYKVSNDYMDEMFNILLSNYKSMLKTGKGFHPIR